MYVWHFYPKIPTGLHSGLHYKPFLLLHSFSYICIILFCPILSSSPFFIFFCFLFIYKCRFCHVYHWINAKFVSLMPICTGPLKKLFHYAIFQKFFHMFIHLMMYVYHTCNLVLVPFYFYKSSLPCYSVLSTIAQVLRKISLKILASRFWMLYLSQTFESYQRVKIYTYSENDLGLKKFLQVYGIYAHFTVCR